MCPVESSRSNSRYARPFLGHLGGIDGAKRESKEPGGQSAAMMIEIIPLSVVSLSESASRLRVMYFERSLTLNYPSTANKEADSSLYSSSNGWTSQLIENTKTISKRASSDSFVGARARERGGKTQGIPNEVLMIAEEGTDPKERDRACQKRLNVDRLKE